MTAISTGRVRPKLANSSLGACPAKASTSIPMGAVVAADSSGYAVNGAADKTHLVLGCAIKDCDNSSGSNGTISCEYERGTFPLENSTSSDEITQAHFGRPVFLADNNTAALTDGSGTRPYAGICKGLASDGRVLVEMSEAISIALKTLGVSAGAVSRIQVATGTITAGACTINTGIVVTATTFGIAIPTANITGSTNVGTMAFIDASKVAGAAGVGSVLFRVLGDDGAVDADAAGSLIAILFN